ncbi:MAG TPA: hypothetical protein EYP85_14650, partial [Armatimonadetes bacterium]|nr:hypothetical protein [Armatimonadota bacterium]
MAGTTEGKIRVEQIEGLEEFLKGFFQQQWGIMIQPLVQDMEELKKSPAGTMIRLEETTNFLRGGLERLEDAIEELRGVQMRMLERMATKEELQALTGRVEQLAAQMATKEELQRLA